MVRRSHVQRESTTRRWFAGLVCAVACALPVVTTAQGDLRERTLFVSVVDKSETPVEGLGPDDFIVREDGLQREILRVSRATEPMDIAVLIDNASASGEVVPRVREGLKRFVAALTPQHAVALVTLADRPTLIVDYTTSAAALEAGIGRLFTMTSSGATVLDGIGEIADGLRRREAARAVIIPVVTSGIEYSNRRSREVLSSLERSGAALYPVMVGRFGVGANDIERERLTVLGMGPAASGGRQISLLSSVSVDAALERLGRRLASQYKVVYSRPESLIPPEKIVASSARPGLTASGVPLRAAANGGVR